MRLTCSWCGKRDAGEFTYKGDATVARPPIESDILSDFEAYVYDRSNIAGLHEEIWQHTGGCRSHIKVVRDTVTHEVHSCEPLGRWQSGSGKVAGK